MIVPPLFRQNEVLRVTLLVMLIFAAAELLIMLALALLPASVGHGSRAILDVLLLTLLSTPLLLHWVIRPFIAARESAVAEARHMALHDPLTRLANRRLLAEHLQRCLASSERHGQMGALLLLDLDGFKQINDTHGHEAGDAILQETAHRLRTTIRSEDIPARLGGDEFVVLLQDLGESPAEARNTARGIAEKLRNRLLETIDHDGFLLRVGCSIGIFLIPPHRTPADLVLRDADAAMYAAKRSQADKIMFADEIDIPWYSELKTGIVEIDQQHQAIDTLIHDALAAPPPYAPAVRAVADHLKKHFRDEETLCAARGLALTASHLDEHRHLSAALDKLAGSAADELNIETLMELQKTLKSHIHRHDKNIISR